MSHTSLTDWLIKLDLFGEKKGREDFHLEDTLEHLRHLLPNQGPIKDFIHHNPLHGFQSIPFHEGVALASKLFGAKSYLDPEFYQTQFKKGLITEAQFKFVVEQLSNQNSRTVYEENRPSAAEAKAHRPADVSQWGLRSFWKFHHQLDLVTETSPILFKLLSSYLDQGIAFWPLPSRKDSFWLSLRTLYNESPLPLIPFQHNRLKSFFEKTPEEALISSLEKLIGNPEFFSRYLIETLLSYPGWAGMVCALEVNPSVLRKPSNISLLDFLAVTIGLECLLVETKLGADFQLGNATDNILPQPAPTNANKEPTVRYWHEAFEWSFYEQILRAVKYNTKNRPKSTSPWAQAIFCLDEREGSVRQYLEELDPGIETFGTAGFFGIDFWFLAHDELYPLQQSPVTLTPKHLIRSVPKHKGRNKKPKNNIFDTILGGLFRDLFLVPFLSVSAITQLFKSIFFAKNSSAISSSLSQFESQAMLEFKSTDEETKDSRFKNGFTVDEMAERVSRTLMGMGLTQNFASCIYVVAHGASSSNNPHFAAYDCGACSGKSGAPNARGFAWMANYPPVRNRLKEMGILIPESTVFYAVIHDTTQDKCLFFEEDLELSVIPEEHRKFRDLFSKVLKLNAKERARRLDLVPKNISIEKNAEKMAQRAHSIFEPRPELNHATNAATVVGRRELTRGLFLDRRTFLQSYDPATDPNGDILLGLLSAVIPVCGGINLEYFFSRMDNEIYGAGTKLSHNVVGLLGVSNGVNNDLIPGLPLQMIEAHDPVRLLILIDQEPDIVKKTLERNSFLYEWVNNHWVRLATISPKTQEISFWLKDGWIKIPISDPNKPPELSLQTQDFLKVTDNLSISVLTPSPFAESRL